MRNNFPYSRQEIVKEDIKKVCKVLKSDLITQGPQVIEFEKKVAKFTGAKYACAVNSATSALILAVKAIGLKKDDIAWTTPNTFAATANCVLHSGGVIEFVDINKDDYNLDLKLLEKKLNLTPKKFLPKLVIPVHFAGCPYDQKKLFLLSKKFNFKIIEDASHAIGAKYYGENVGSCKWSDITVFSFHPVKIITTGEGGMALTNNKYYFEKIKLLHTHGITRDIKKLKKKINSYWYYEQQDLGYNFRMSDVNACLGISQLRRINSFIKKRKSIAKYYLKKLKHLPLIFQKINSNYESVYHLFIIRLLNKKNILNYNKIFNFMRSKGVFVNLHYYPLHLHPIYKKYKFNRKQLLESEYYAKSSLSIPIYKGLKLNNLKLITKVIEQAINKYK